MGKPSPAVTPDQDADWIPLSEASELLGVHVETVRRLVKAEELSSRNPAIRKTQVKRSEVLARLSPGASQ